MATHSKTLRAVQRLRRLARRRRDAELKKARTGGAAAKPASLCLRLQRGGGVRGWGRDGLGTGA